MDAPPAGMKNDLVRSLIDSFNEATDAIPCWDAYRCARVCVCVCDRFVRVSECVREGCQPMRHKSLGQVTCLLLLLPMLQEQGRKGRCP